MISYVVFSVMKQWAQLFYDAGDAMGRDFRFTEESMTKWARDTGFENITGKTIKVPHGTWPKDKKLKEMGAFIELYMDLSLDGFALYPIGQVLGWSKDEVDVLVSRMRRAIRNPRNLTNADM